MPLSATPRTSPRARPPLPGVAWALLVLVVCVLTSCRSTQPDKRLLQYLNDSGFGNRYTGNSEEQNYVTIGDAISITDAYQPELNVVETVDIDGTIVLPEIGAVHVAGLTRSDLEAFLLQKYSPYFEQLNIEVRIQSTTGKFYFVVGEVEQEGVRPFPGDLTVFQAVMSATVKTRSANLARVRVIRADPRDPQIIYVNVSDIISRGDSTFNVLVQERDIIYVPPTVLAQLGYFISDLIFPITQVISEISRSLFYFWPGFFQQGGIGGIF